MAEEGESSRRQLGFNFLRYSEVAWSGPNSKKGKGSGKVGTNGGNGEGSNERCNDKESYVEGSGDLKKFSQKITYERKSRSCSKGDYSTKPPEDAKPTVHFLKTRKGIKEAAAKHTLSHIVRIKWDENTLNSKGSKREEFYISCIKTFKEYYNYPKGYGEENGDRAVRDHMAKNFKYFLNPEKKRLKKIVNHVLDCGYDEKDIDIKLLKPHYYSQRAWNAICDHWGTPQFETKSIQGQKARMCVEFTPRTGAKPFDQRREEIDAEREANGEDPITEDEFLGIVYNPSEPAVKDLKEQIEKVRSSLELPPELLPTDQPSSPRTQREIQRKRDIFVMMQARPPKKGKILLHPHETVSELIGAREATQWINKENQKNLLAPVPDEIYMMMSTILDEVRQMVSSLPMHEVKQSVLDEKVGNLAAAAFPDPSQKSLQAHYERAARGLLRTILKDNDKIIVEESPPKKDMMMLGGKEAVVVNDDINNNEDEDPLAHMYPL